MEPSISDVGAMSSLCVFRHHVSSIVIDAMKAPHFEISTQALRNYSSYDIKLAVDLHTPSQGNFIHSGHLRFAVKVEILQPFQGLWTTTLKYMQQILHITLKKKWADRSCQYLWMFFQKRWCVFFPALIPGRRREGGHHDHGIQFPPHVLDSSSASRHQVEVKDGFVLFVLLKHLSKTTLSLANYNPFFYPFISFDREAIPPRTWDCLTFLWRLQ